MKKIIAIGIIGLLLVSLISCTSQEGNPSETVIENGNKLSNAETAMGSKSESQQTANPSDEVTSSENNEPPQQITINGNVLTYQSTYCSDGLPQYPYEQNTDAGYPIDLYVDEEQGEYEICRCGRPIKYRDNTPYVGTEFSMTKEEFLKIITPKLKGFFGTVIDHMEVTTYYPETKEGWLPTHEFLIVFKQRVGEDNFLNLNYLRLFAGLDGSIISFTFHYHSHDVEALDREELSTIKKADVDAYVQEIIETDPKNLYQHVNKDDIYAHHRVIYKDGKIVLETRLQGVGIGAEEYYCELSKFI